jgi:hypothetical protein
MSKISKNHTNRGRHNWLIYDMSDSFLLGCKELYRGELYDLGAGESPYKKFFLNMPKAIYPLIGQAVTTIQLRMLLQI